MPTNLWEYDWKEYRKGITMITSLQKVCIHWVTAIVCTNSVRCLKHWKYRMQRQRWKNNGNNWRKFWHGSWRKSETRKRWSMKQGVRVEKFILRHWFPCGELWLEICVGDVAILFFQLFDFPGSLICWMHGFSPAAVLCAMGFTVTASSWLQVSDSERSTSPDSSFAAAGFPWLCPSTRQGMHLAVALENLTLRQISNYFSSCFHVPRSGEYPRTFGCNRTFCGWGTCRNMWRQVHRCRFRFCHDSVLSFLGQLIKLEFWAQQVELKWLMLNKWRRLFHSSRVKLPSVKMSASWWLVSMYRIFLNLESRLIFSNNKSKATLWVLDTCLMVGLRAFIIN